MNITIKIPNSIIDFCIEKKNRPGQKKKANQRLY